MEYKVHNDKFTSTTMKASERKKWDILKNLYDSEFSVDELIQVLETVDKFKKKYPGDGTFTDFEECVREEICSLFGGTLENE